MPAVYGTPWARGDFWAVRNRSSECFEYALCPCDKYVARAFVEGSLKVARSRTAPGERIVVTNADGTFRCAHS